MNVTEIKESADEPELLFQHQSPISNILINILFPLARLNSITVTHAFVN